MLDSAVGFRRWRSFLKKKNNQYENFSLAAEKVALGRCSSMSASYLEQRIRGGILLLAGISAPGLFALVSSQSPEKIISVAQRTISNHISKANWLGNFLNMPDHFVSFHCCKENRGTAV